MLPALFLAHGSPMNMVADNSFTRDLISLSKILPQPEAIVVVSAHWLTNGTFITSSPAPDQIYDFYGFPQELYSVKYRAPGSVKAADLTAGASEGRIVKPDPERGIDHAAWTVLRYLYPEATIPVLELSLDYTKPARFHFELGKELAFLRKKGILVIGSGNIIHNLGEVDFDDDAAPSGWALEFDGIVERELSGKYFQSLVNYEDLGTNSLRAIPFFDHYLPMLYILGMTEPDEKVRMVHNSIQNGTISMRSFIVDKD